MRNFKIFSLLLVLCGNIANTRAQDNVEQKKMPAFSYEKLDQSKYTNSNLHSGKPVIIVYFNPHCDICKAETKLLLKNISLLKEAQILYISPGTEAELKQFVTRYSFDKYPMITVLQDKEDTFFKTFSAKGYPSIYVYNKKGQQLGFFEGETDINLIKATYQNPTVSVN